jgi:membrane fusion protein, heavy metal efflux system
VFFLLLMRMPTNLRISLPANPWPALARYSNGLVGGAIVLAGLALLLALWLGWIDILSYTSQVASPEPKSPTAAAPTTVELPPEKLAAADLHLTVVQTEPLQPMRAVPGEIDYDKEKRVPITAPVAGVVLQVLVDPGQQVAKDQPLAVLSSRQVGEARDEVEKRKADLELARVEEARSSRIAANVDELLEMLSQRPDPESAESVLQQKALGDYRDKIIGAYSRLVLAERRMKDTTDIGGATLSARIVEQRKSDREVAAAQYDTARDNSRFDATREREKAKAVREQAERLLAVAQQALANLLGPLADMRPVTDREHLSEMTLLAPIAGRIEERNTVKAALVAAGGPLFIIADTSEVWVSAEIHERDWRALDFVKQGDELKVRVFALENAMLTAKVQWVGPQLGDITRSVPLVAELSNDDGKLKPNMFVWVLVPLDKPHDGLVVPAGAIMRHENQPFVFVPDGERRFRRVDVELGLETNDRIEIVSGLKLGDTVVDRGAFYLKSELLLEREE